MKIVLLYLFPSLLIGSSSVGQNERVIRGWEATPGQFPWMAEINADYARCGAVIISARHVLTAAHCYKKKFHPRPDDYTVVVGAHNIEDKNEPTQKRFSVCRFDNHPNYILDMFPTTSDVAVITLKTPIEFNDWVKPIRLGTKNVPLGTTCLISGWGDVDPAPGVTGAEILQFINLTSISNEECSKRPMKYPNDTHGSPRPINVTYHIDDSMFCMIYPGGRRTPYRGDSGSPLACFDDQGPYLAGLVSWGSDYYDSLNSSTTVFTRIAHAYDFITCGGNKQRG